MRNSFVFYKSFLDCLSGLSDEMQLHLYQAIAGYGIEERINVELTPTENAIMALIIPQIDAASERYERRGGRPKKNPENPNEKVSKPFSEVSKPKSEIEKGFDLNIDNDKNKDKNIDIDEEEEEDSKPEKVASSSSSSLDINNFSPTDFILKWWNVIAERHPHMKKVTYISRSLEAKVNDRYKFALECNNNNVIRAKNMLASAVSNMGESDFFADNAGKSTLTWLFASDDNLEKTANGNYNNDVRYR